MAMDNGGDLMNKLMKAQGFCPNCGAKLTFEDSANLAKDHGVSEDAVMCYNCHKVFTVNLAPNKMTVLGELTKYNFSANSNTQKVEEIPAGFQKRVDRDKKIILGAIAITAILIILSLVALPSLMEVDYYDLDGYYDTTSSSGVTVEVTNAYEEVDGWYNIYGIVTPESRSDYQAITTFYDSEGYELMSTYEYLPDAEGEIMLASADMTGYDVDYIVIGIVDEDYNLVAETTYYV